MGDPDTDFGSGMFRIESPGKLLDAAKRWSIKEDFLLVAEDCRIGPVVLNGTSPGFRDVDNGIVALDLQLAFEFDDGTKTAVDVPSLITSDFYGALIEYKGQTYAVRVEFDLEDTVYVRGADGRWVCDISLDTPCQELIE